MYRTASKKGFTLVELIVVVGIIAILSAVVMVSISGARARANDAKRIASLEQVKLSLEVYKQAYGTYPDSSAADGSYGTESSSPTGYISGMTNIITLPRDPVNAALGFKYKVSSDGQSYRLENSAIQGTDITPTHEQAPCASSCTGSCATSGGAYTDATTRKTVAVWEGTAYQCRE